MPSEEDLAASVGSAVKRSPVRAPDRKGVTAMKHFAPHLIPPSHPWDEYHIAVRDLTFPKYMGQRAVRSWTPDEDWAARTSARIAPEFDPVTGWNTAGFAVRRVPESPVIVHIPHAGLAWLDDGAAIPDCPDLASEIVLMADLAIDRIADLVDALAAESGHPATNRFQALISRVAMDPERFDNSTEEMNRVGMGVVYERTHTGAPLYQDGLKPGDRERRRSLWYAPYTATFSSLVDDVLDAHGRCLIVDLHSYATKAQPYELHKKADRPPVCLGYDAPHDGGISEAGLAFQGHGYRVNLNQPFAGSYVPASRWLTDRRVRSLMIEVRKDQYLEGTQVDNHRALPLAFAIEDAIWRLQQTRRMRVLASG